MKKKILAIIPARGGSKAIPNKNLKKLAGKPLIYYPIKLAKSIETIDRVIVSTEDKKIAELAKEFGAEIPFLRPQRLAQDKVETILVLKHCLDQLQQKEAYVPDIVILLYATGPLISQETLSRALNLFLNNKYLSLVPVIEDHGHYWQKDKNNTIKMFFPLERKNRQSADKLLRESGGFYIFDRKVVENFSLYGKNTGYIIVPKIEDIDIDDIIDFQVAEVKSRLINKK